MRKLLLLLPLLWAVLAGYAQIVTTTPTFITENTGEIRLIFDATQGNAGLKDYAGTVYAHTGVITSASKSDSDWKYVQSDWGENTDKCKLTSLGDNKWQLMITPSLREYYGVPADEKILKLAFVFRSGEKKDKDSYYEGKDVVSGNWKDIFVNVYEAGLNVNFAAPTADQVVQAGAKIDFQVDASLSAQIELLINDNSVKSVSAATELAYTHTFSQTGDYTVVAKAAAEEFTAFDTLYVCVPQSPTADKRPAGVQDGINPTGEDAVTFSLYAPGKQNVFLVGDFNNWTQLNAYQMKCDGDYWWYTLTGVDADRLYRFQYVVDGVIRIPDPYTELALTPDDQWINHEYERYPDLPAYPSGRTDGLVATFQLNRPAYSWEVEDFDMPSKTNMVIYELLLRDFTQEQSLQAALDRIDYLANLGVTAVELMPIQEFSGNSSWGYNPDLYFAPDKAYGSPEMYKRFIDECHKRGIAVILDVVLNHATGSHPFARLYWDGKKNKPLAINPWFNVDAPHPYSVNQDFNHSKERVRDHFKRMLQYWITEYKVDGYRLDLSKGLTQRQCNESTAPNYDAERIGYLTEYYEAAKEVNPDVMFILEHFCDGREEGELASKGMYLWRNVNNAFSQSAMGYQSDSDFSGMNSLPRNWVGYAESHDEERNFFKAKTWGDGGMDTDSVMRIGRAPLNLAFATLVSGPKMMWQFAELGYDVETGTKSNNTEHKRMEEKPSGFIFYNISAPRREAYLDCAKILNLRKRYPNAFNEGNCQLNIGSTDWNAGKRIAITHDELNMVALGNFKATDYINATPNFPKTGDWYELITGEKLTVTHTDMTISLPPGEVRIYTDRRVDNLPGLPDLPPEPNGVAQVEKTVTDYLYPGVTDGSVYVSTAGTVYGVTVYDLRGHAVATSRMETIDLTGCAEGLYVVRLHTSEGHSVHKVVKR